jgi:hydroxymethylbilane synthase
MTLRIGTRGSALALWQANEVARLLGGDTEIVTLKTTGDKRQDVSLAQIGGKGLWVKELEEALLRGEIDCAVHSLKDVPSIMPEEFELAAFLERADPRDAWVHPGGATIDAMKPGAKIATSAPRRRAQLQARWPHLRIEEIRGNVDTRLRKLDAGEMDAVLLAYAGLKRLGVEARATEILSASDWLPSLGQGVIGIEIREADTFAREELAFLNDEPSELALLCERAFQAALDGSCRTPIAGLAQVEGGTLSFRGEVLSPDGGDSATTGFTVQLGHNPREAAEKAGRDCGLALRPRVAQWLAL